MEGYVYRIIAPGSNSVYVGQSVNPRKRFRSHKLKPCNPALANFLKKHPDAEMYFWPVLDMNAEEIADEKLCRESGFVTLNLQPCGGWVPNNTGRKHSPETRAKISAAHIGMKHTTETRKRLSEAGTGKKLSSESIRKRTAKQVGQKRSPEFCAKMSAQAKGRTFSAETRAKMRANKLGKTLTTAARARLSSLYKGVPWTAARRAAQTDEVSAKMSASAKRRAETGIRGFNRG